VTSATLPPTAIAARSSLVRRHPEDYEPTFERQFVDLIARLDPKATA
jgi:hypothetical protein